MEFSGQYLTYQDYKALGGTLDMMPFNILEFEARKNIDERTHNRLKDIIEIPKEVKLCEYNIINTLQHYVNENNRILASESVGSYSVDYKDNVEQVIRNKKAEVNDIILSELYGIVVNDEHILYCGV